MRRPHCQRHWQRQFLRGQRPERLSSLRSSRTCSASHRSGVAYPDRTGRSQRTWEAPKSMLPESGGTARRKGCSPVHRGSGRNSHRSGWESRISDLQLRYRQLTSAISIQTAPQRTLARYTAAAEIIPCARLVSAELIHGLPQRAARLAELNHARLKVVERPFDERVLFLVVCQ